MQPAPFADEAAALAELAKDEAADRTAIRARFTVLLTQSTQGLWRELDRAGGAPKTFAYIVSCAARLEIPIECTDPELGLKRHISFLDLIPEIDRGAYVPGDMIRICAWLSRWSREQTKTSLAFP